MVVARVTPSVVWLGPELSVVGVADWNVPREPHGTISLLLQRSADALWRKDTRRRVDTRERGDAETLSAGVPKSRGPAGTHAAGMQSSISPVSPKLEEVSRTFFRHFACATARTVDKAFFLSLESTPKISEDVGGGVRARARAGVRACVRACACGCVSASY